MDQWIVNHDADGRWRLSASQETGPSGALPMIAARPLERYQVSKMREELLAGDASPVLGGLSSGFQLASLRIGSDDARGGTLQA